MAQSLSGFALLNIHVEWLFEWAVEILTKPSADKRVLQQKRIKRDYGKGSRTLWNRISQTRWVEVNRVVLQNYFQGCFSMIKHEEGWWFEYV